jgi:hypothetical protein
MDLLQSIQDVLSRQWSDLLARPSGPMSFRFLLQPAMAIAFAIRDGIKDAKLGRSPYFWTITHDRSKRWRRVREEFVAIGKVMLLGFGMDAIYQFIALRMFYPVEAIIVVLMSAFIPYQLARGPALRIARWWLKHHAATPPPDQRK